MIRYLLDTNVLVDLLRGKNAEAVARFKEMGIDHCVISDITIYELYSGIAASSKPQENRELMDRLFQKLAVIPASDGYWKAALEKQRLAKAGTSMEDFDFLIGCTALEHGLTLVTGNVKHLSRIRGLRIEPWV